MFGLQNIHTILDILLVYVWTSEYTYYLRYTSSLCLDFRIYILFQKCIHILVVRQLYFRYTYIYLSNDTYTSSSFATDTRGISDILTIPEMYTYTCRSTNILQTYILSQRYILYLIYLSCIIMTSNKLRL